MKTTPFSKYSISCTLGPSFLDDPSGYLAQQTALLNSTISRQTGVNNSGNGAFLTKSKPSSNASQKSNPTSPIFVHSSMTPTPAGSMTESEGGSPPYQRCASADTQSALSSRTEVNLCPLFNWHGSVIVTQKSSVDANPIYSLPKYGIFAIVSQIEETISLFKLINK